MSKIKVLVIDDSTAMQNIISMILRSDSDISIVGVAGDPFEARDKIKELKPDVLTLDIEMPRMDGVTFVENLMRLHPLPVIICSSVTRDNAAVSLRALELGAIDVVTKPKNAEEFDNFSSLLIEKVKSAAGALNRDNVKNTTMLTKTAEMQKISKSHIDLIAIGSSTGGTEAIRKIFQSISKKVPPIIITQHLPPAFVEMFAESLTRTTNIETIVATEGVLLESGKAYIATGNHHMHIIKNSSGLFQIKLVQEPPINGHIPSVDAMFSSVAKNNPRSTLAILLTGMGSDGANGMLNIKEQGGVTIAQDQASSVVWGMPRSAIEKGAIEYVMSLAEIPSAILSCNG